MNQTPYVTTRIYPNGLHINCVDWGNQGAMPLVLVHGARSHAHSWDPIARALSPSYHVVAFDLRGRGGSDWSREADYGYRANAADLTGVIEHFGFDRPVIIGHSEGGKSAILYAATNPERVRAMVIEDIGPGDRTPTALARLARERDNTPASFTSWEEAHAFCRQQRPLASAEAIDLQVANMLKEDENGAIVWKFDIEGLSAPRSDAGTPDWWDLVGKLACPTLVLRGAHSDMLERTECEKMVRLNTNIRWVEIPAATHFVHEENSRAFTDEVTSFLQGL
ncbi:MAG: alpha/beta fold hydrolase [Candidatus Latescibacteria bacterium]|nr:alpha/beta fold hydrolase [Candidatus Latescibacterota bacterium]